MSWHTPGPWTAVCGETNSSHYDAWGCVQARDCYVVADVFNGRDELESSAARNAILIAASPDILAALKAHDAYMSSHFNDGPDSTALHSDARENWKRARAAIAKAEGQEVTR